MRNLRLLILPTLIFLVFLALAGLFSQGILPNPVFYLRVDSLTLALGIGLCLFVLAAVSLALWKRIERVHQQQVERVRLQEQLQAADNRRRFLQRLHHELKNHLTAIPAGLANLAEPSSAEARRETLARVEARTQRLSRLADGLHKLAELETHPLERTSISVVDLLRESLVSAQEQPEAKARYLSLMLPQAPWPLPNVLGDRELLSVAVSNLLDNALKFTQPGDTIEIRASEDGAKVVIEVADTGPGIPEGEIPHVWEELYRGQEKRGVPGSGLGLALVRAIIDRHSGQITLRSRSGQGTVVTVWLPVG